MELMFDDYNSKQLLYMYFTYKLLFFPWFLATKPSKHDVVSFTISDENSGAIMQKTAPKTKVLINNSQGCPFCVVTV